MNCYHYILIAFSVILIFEASYDYLSEKFNHLPKREKFKFLPEKGGQRFFLYFIYLFPLIITVISPVKNEFNIFDSIKKYMSFYATALTITYTVYTFNKQQEKFLEEKQKENEIKEKELEAKRDYYRPIFVIETDQHNNKSARLLMKNDDFYLENIKYLTLENTDVKYSGPCKHREVIISKITNNFFVTAETLIGEIILFGYIDGKKIYKYLNANQNPLLPNEEDYKKEEADKIWGSFNTLITGNNIGIEFLFFKYTDLLRRNLYKDDYRTLQVSLQANTLKEFFNNIFTDLIKYVKKNNLNNIGNNNNIIHNILHLFTEKLGNYKSGLKIDINNRVIVRNLISTKCKPLKKDYSEIIHDTKDELDNSRIFDIIIDDFLPDYLENCQQPDSTSINCLTDFETLFNYIEFDSSLDKELHLFVEIALTHLN